MKKLLILAFISLTSMCLAHTPGEDFDDAEMSCYLGEHEYHFSELTRNPDEADYEHVFVTVYGDKYYFKKMDHIEKCSYCEHYEKVYGGK